MGSLTGSAQGKTRSLLRRALGLFGLVLPVLGVVIASCKADPRGSGPRPGALGGGGESDCIGLGCEDDCAASPRPGCPCDTEGQQMFCGQVVADIDGESSVCGQGFSACTGGEWGECIINNAVTLLPDTPPGYYLKSLGPGTTCANNPCSPSCIDFLDTPAGLADAGTGLKESDAGLTLVGDGGSVCVPKTCVDLGKDCGPVSDGCGALVQCGTCSAPKTCGGAGVPSVCGVATSCTNLCLQQVTCPNGGTTSVTGKVYAPNKVDPLPNAIVYVPNAPVTPFPAGVSCDNCANATGSPLVATTSGADGSFTLTNMPVGNQIPLVIQIGRWRRQVTIPVVQACTSTAVPSTLTRLPRNKGEGDIPKMAFVTGKVDAMECVWRKIGLSDSEFTNPSGTGRINFYAGGYAPGTYIGNTGGSGGTPWESSLLSSPSKLAQYDMVLFPCQGTQYHYSGGAHQTYQNNLAAFANAGGRIFATHYSYIWLYKDNWTYFSPLSTALAWSINQTPPTPDPQTGHIDTSFPKGALLSQWLQVVGASSTPGQISINTLRRDFNGMNGQTQRWMSINSPSAGIPQHVTFNTPLGAPAASQCGRVVFSDFHVEDSTNAAFAFPTECSNGAMTPQEKLLEFMLFDLASCVTPDQPVACVPASCSAQGLNCGPAGDGCGGTLNCGTCAAPTTCGGGGQSGVCGTPFSYSEGYFARDYEITTCAKGTSPVWRLWSWNTLTPSDSRVDFTVQTAKTKAGLAAAPADRLLFSSPPGPAALVGTNAAAHAANVPVGAPDTRIGSAMVDYTLWKNSRTRNNKHLRITSRLAPSTDKQKAPTLVSWDLQVDCVDSE